MKVRQQSPSVPVRVLHVPTANGGIPPLLARTERDLGLKSHSIAFARDWLDYIPDERLSDSTLIRQVQRLDVLWRALRCYDIIHFNCGASILPLPPLRPVDARGPLSTLRHTLANTVGWVFALRDLPILKLFGKGIVVTYYGSDARQEKYCREHFAISPAGETTLYDDATDIIKQRLIKTVDRYADEIFALNPDLLHVLPSRARFLPYANVDLRAWEPFYPSPTTTRPMVLHAPTNRGVKGTRFIEAAVDALRKKHVPFDWRIVEQTPHKDAVLLYRDVDVLVDQLLLGWYGGLATEIMAKGKPVICYIRQEDLKFVPEEMSSSIPVIQATPATIEDVLEEWLTTRAPELHERGLQSRAFVERWHDPVKIAEQLQGVYRRILGQTP